jgi:tetratricopeptide (TPR) repeat protein
MVAARPVSNNKRLATGLLFLAASLSLCGQVHVVDRLFPPAEVTPPANRVNVPRNGLLEGLLQDGFDAYKRGDYRKCLSDYQTVSAMNPKQSAGYRPAESIAQNMIGNCAKELGDYPTSIAAFKAALELDSIKYYNVLGLASSYSLAGMKDELAAELQELDSLHAQNRLPNVYFVSDIFDVGDKSVRVSRWYPRCEGCGELYAFDVSDSAGRFLFRAWYGKRLVADSPSPEKKSEAKKDATASLYILNDSTWGPQKHGLYKLFGAEQTYESICHGIADLIEEKLAQVKSKILWPPDEGTGEVYIFQPAPGLEPAK